MPAFTPRALRISVRVLLTLTFCACAALMSLAQTTPPDWAPVEQALGFHGSVQPGDVFKAGMPRADLKVMIDGIQVQPGLALGSWVAFKRMGTDAMVMGDLVLTEDEIESVIDKLQQGGIQQTAVHNHLLHETPRVLYVHIFGHGDPTALARTLHDSIALTKTPHPPSTPSTAKPAFDTGAIEQALGYKGKPNGSVFQVSVPRAETIRDNGMEIPPSMGVATAINFQAATGANIATTGDFVLLASEVNPVIRALRASSIQVTALHSHMLTEEPRIFFMHFWGNGDVQKISNGIKAALAATNSAKPSATPATPAPHTPGTEPR